MSLFCHLLSVWSWLTGGSPYTSGHDLVDLLSYRDGDRLILPARCERCGTVSLGWKPW